MRPYKTMYKIVLKSLKKIPFFTKNHGGREKQKSLRMILQVVTKVVVIQRKREQFN